MLDRARLSVRLVRALRAARGPREARCQAVVYRPLSVRMSGPTALGEWRGTVALSPGTRALVRVLVPGVGEGRHA